MIKTILNRFLAASPPPLSLGYRAADFKQFMSDETYLFSSAYARHRVLINGTKNIASILKRQSAIIAFMHHGSFFLIGGALYHQLNYSYSAIVSRLNFSLIDEQSQKFWLGVHKRSAKLYSNQLFYSDDSPRKLLRWLSQSNNLLGIVMDVREAGRVRHESKFDFLGEKLYLQTGPARLARIAKVDIVPAVIVYDLKKKKHSLTLLQSIPPTGTEQQITQHVLSALEPYIEKTRNQEFYDFVARLRVPHL